MFPLQPTETIPIYPGNETNMEKHFTQLSLQLSPSYWYSRALEHPSTHNAHYNTNIIAAIELDKQHPTSHTLAQRGANLHNTIAYAQKQTPYRIPDPLDTAQHYMRYLH